MAIRFLIAIIVGGTILLIFMQVHSWGQGLSDLSPQYELYKHQQDYDNQILEQQKEQTRIMQEQLNIMRWQSLNQYPFPSDEHRLRRFETEPNWPVRLKNYNSGY